MPQLFGSLKKSTHMYLGLVAARPSPGYAYQPGLCPLHAAQRRLALSLLQLSIDPGDHAEEPAAAEDLDLEAMTLSLRSRGRPARAAPAPMVIGDRCWLGSARLSRAHQCA